MVNSTRQRAIFLDRDGTLIHDAGYVNDPQDVQLIPGSLDALARLQKAGFALVIVSNQSGIGRGLISRSEARAVHERLEELLAEGGVSLDGAYYCPHTPEDGCDCRKPSPGLVEQAADQLGLDLDHSFVVGDQDRDVEAGRRAGCNTAKLTSTHPSPCRSVDVVADTWDSMADKLLSFGCSA